ncbi:MAG TPA: HAMP domain-containing sensor histidine kinase [Solirubrobacteraceae bacterium]|jgi:signal transduction histidine kinase|nr:HAMP domain-containing sensor histidine kinase [Solirubrobacteraceae bacterium]
MTTPSGPAALRRLWPRRLRTRLALFYSLLFFVAGLALLALIYALATKLLLPGSRPPPLNRLTSRERDILRLCKPTPTAQALLTECKRVLGVLGNGSGTGVGLAAIQIASAIGLGVLLIGAVGLGWLVAGRTLAPMRTITEAAQRASELRLGQRLALAGAEDEFKQLADTFDLMLERLDAAFTSQKRFVGNAAHELRTPLTAMRTAIDVTLSKPHRTPEQLEEMAERVRDSIERAEATIEAMLTLATSEAGATTTETFDLATAAEDALDTTSATINQHKITVDATLEPAPTRGDRVLLERMIANLVENAARHNHPGGWIGIRTYSRDGSTTFEVANTGPEVSAEQLPRLFEPFARGSDRLDFQAGVGLGLSIAEAIARAHETTITASPRSDGGLQLSITLAN